jgi:hypothetical protein
MNKLQARAFTEELHRIVERAGTEDPADQVFWRVSNERKEGHVTCWDIETRIENPDQGFESDWSWSDVITLGPRGRIIR